MAQKKAPVARIEQDTPATTSDEPLRATVVTEPEPAPAPKPAPAPAPQSEPARPKTTVKVDTALQQEAPSAGSAPQAKEAPADAPTGAKTKSGSFAPISWLGARFPGHENAALGGIAGLIVALLIFFVGFWQTLFVALMVCVGIAVGQLLDGDPKIIRALKKLLDNLRGTNE